MENKDIKAMKMAQNVLIVINLFFSMIYAMAVDSLDNFDLVVYFAVLAGMWYIVKVMNDRIEEEKKKSSDEN